MTLANDESPEPFHFLTFPLDILLFLLMDLSLPIELGRAYESLSQRIRVVTEAWTAMNLFCPACPSERILRTLNNTPVVDFRCPACSAEFQLKSKAGPIGRKVMDAGYHAMLRAIATNGLPHFLLLSYESGSVRDLVFVPNFALSPSAIEARAPLSKTARRAGWIGCNIVLSSVPIDGRIDLVRGQEPFSKEYVRAKFEAFKGFSSIPTKVRGWTLDLLNLLRRTGRSTFTLTEVYKFENTLASLHPKNRNVRPKIRQQLQVLRDHSLLSFLGNGVYKMAGQEEKKGSGTFS